MAHSLVAFCRTNDQDRRTQPTNRIQGTQELENLLQERLTVRTPGGPIPQHWSHISWEIHGVASFHVETSFVERAMWWQPYGQRIT